MVPAFDKVVFNDAVGVIHGPVQTQFGSHLILITERE
jgi:peptidyl-prolyl cis-trans isomerase C